MPDEQNGEQSAFQRAGISCSGGRPWLGDGADEDNCSRPLVGALINQTNLYFSRTVSAISLPDLQAQSPAVAQLRNQIEADPGPLGVALTRWRGGDDEERADVAADMKRKLARRGIQAEEHIILEALKNLFDGTTATTNAAVPVSAESELLAFRRAEFNIIRSEVEDPQRIPNLRVIPTKVSDALTSLLSRVTLVERLREMRVFYGFDRLRQGAATLNGLPDAAMQQLFREPPTQAQDRWLPVLEVFGEGIYLELNEETIGSWQNKNAKWLEERLDDAYVTRLAGIPQVVPPLSAANRTWAARYLLVHSIAHIIVNQLVFECGYSAASLRERLYVSSDAAAPMAAMLIYTAAGDSDGTLGGLVRLGRSERFGGVLQRALARASWCSADPICSEQLGGQGSRLANLAACHACILLPETSCETINQGLDRAMVVGTPAAREPGFMSALLESGHALD